MMRQRLNSDGIDESQWLPDKAPRINAYRYAKGDLHQDDDTGLVRSPVFPIDEIYRRGWIEQHHLWAGEVMARIHTAAFMHVGYRVMRDIITSFMHGDARSDLAPMDIFTRVMRHLTPWQRNIVSRLCWGEVKDIDYGWIHHCKGSVQDSFERLQKVLEDVLKPEYSPNIEKPEVSLKA